MSKANLVNAIVESKGCTKKEAEEAINMVVDGLTSTTKQHQEVNIIGFGKFHVKERAARTGRNPQTGEPMEMPAKKLPAFKAGAKLKEAAAE